MLPLSAFVIIIDSSFLKLLRIFMSLIELLGISGFKANSDRALTVEALTRLTSLIKMGFLCKDVSIEEIISSTGTLLFLRSYLRQIQIHYVQADCQKGASIICREGLRALN